MVLAIGLRPCWILRMGMQGCFVSLSEADLDAVFEDPSRMLRLVELQASNSLERLGNFMGANEIPEELKAAIKELQKSSETGDDSWQPQMKPDFLDIDKAWNGIHYLLTSDDDSAEESPLGFILEGGREIPIDDFGYGPPHAFTASEVRDINSALSQIDVQEFYDRADPKELTSMDIYPGVWDSETKEESIGYLVHHLKELQAFVKRAADSGSALIAYLG